MKVPTPRAIDRSVLAGTKKATSFNGPSRGGNKYQQMNHSGGYSFQPVKGHSQKDNVKVKAYPNDMKS